MQTINITAFPENASQIDAIKSVMKALNIKYEISDSEPYNRDFVEKIERSRQDFKDGKGKVVKLEELKDLWK